MSERLEDLETRIDDLEQRIEYLENEPDSWGWGGWAIAIIIAYILVETGITGRIFDFVLGIFR